MDGVVQLSRFLLYSRSRDPFHEVALGDEEQDKHGDGPYDACCHDQLPRLDPMNPELVEQDLEAQKEASSTRPPTATEME